MKILTRSQRLSREKPIIQVLEQQQEGGKNRHHLKRQQSARTARPLHRQQTSTMVSAASMKQGWKATSSTIVYDLKVLVAVVEKLAKKKVQNKDSEVTPNLGSITHHIGSNEASKRATYIASES
jgi:3-methyladenine DNA glycosylase Tag